jgi:hypothetical protein
MSSIERSSLFAFVRLIAAATLSPLGLLGVLAVLTPAEARADESPVGLSLSIERVAGFAYASLRPTSSDTSRGATTFGIAGPAINPIALPRLGIDVILPIGLTLGGAIGYGHASLSESDGTGATTDSFAGNAWLVSPRVGYLFHVAPIFDVWPRAGITFAGARLQEPDSQSCSSFSSPAGVIDSSCTSTPGPSDSIFVVAASIEVAAALRLTRSFNVLGGIAYDHVFAASGSTTQQSSGNSTSSDAQVQGKYLGAQLWFGLGGYVL